MCVTSRPVLVTLSLFLCISVTSSKPLSVPCTDPKPTDLLALALTETSNFPAGVEVAKEDGVYGYRFFPESKNLGVPASEVMVHCNYFPQEFSVVITFKRELPRNENEYILSLIGRDRFSVLFGVSLQRDVIHVDFARPSVTKRRAASFRDPKLANGEWHTVVVTVTKNKVKFYMDCRHTETTRLSEPFPRKLNTKKSRFHIASRRRIRNRYTGLLRQVRFVPGADASIPLCSDTPSWIKTEVSGSANSPSKSFVHFQEEGDGDLPMTCSSENKGQLMYRTGKGDLELCEGRKWTRLATTNERLDYVTDFGKLTTKSKTHDVEIFRIPGEGLFLASANQGRDRSMDSTIYKWLDRRKSFVPYQNITTDAARDWEFFSIENEHFLAVANQGSAENSLEAQSAIYRWNEMQRKFVLLQLIRTFAAKSWESFTIDGKHYLAVANYARQNGHEQKSWIYIWDPDHRSFIKYQPIDTIGGYDIEYFQIEEKHYIAVANSFNGVTTKMDSVVYQWKLSNFVPLQYFETYGATDWEYFSIGEKHYLAVANYYDNSRDKNTYAINSYIFEYLPQLNQFTKIQNIPTNGALDMESFTVGIDTYLIPSSTDDDNTDQLTTVVYRWQGMEHFVPVHNFSTNPCSDWETFRTDDGKHYLVAANVQSRTSKVLRLVTY